MLDRKEHTEEGKPLPQQWRDEVSKLLKEVYEHECKAKSRDFLVYGFSYSDELLIITTFFNPINIETIPLSCFLSVDLTEKTNVEKILSTMVDALGPILDNCIKTDDFNDYHDYWQETEFNKEKIFYKINRENVALTLEADALLKE